VSVYQIQAPDGNTYSVSGPEGATQAQVQAEVLRQNPQAGQAKQAEPSLADHALNVLKNIGSLNSPGSTLEPLAHLASGAVAAPVAGIAGLGALAGNALGMKTDPASVVQKTQNALTYQPRSAQGQQTSSAMDSLLGIPGQLADQAGGAVTDATGSPALGAATNTGLQGLAMLSGGKAIKALAPADLPAPPKAVTPSVANATLKDARNAGIMVTPEYSKTAGGGGGGAVGEAASLAGSETKMQQTLSKFNGRVALPKIVATDLGLDPNTPLTPAAISDLGQKANNIYTAASKVGDFTPDAQLVADMKKIGVRNAAVDEQFGSDAGSDIQALKTKYSPKAIPPDTSMTGLDNQVSSGLQPMNSEALVQATRDLRADARSLYKQTENPEALRMADATQKAADAIDDFVQRQLRAPVAQGGKGVPNLADAYANARVQKAKIASVNDAYNPATGSIDGASLAKDLDDGLPLSGGLKTIALAYKAFPKVMQVPEKLPSSEGPSILEQGAAVTALLHGNVPLALAMFARPLARARVATPGFQNKMVNPQPPAAPVLPAGVGTAPLASPIVGQPQQPQQLGQP
jgi:hypothetical protein